VSLQSVAAEFAVESVPASMRNRPQWVWWRYEKRRGKQTKVPLNAKTGRRASATDSETWATFDEARAAWRASKNVDGVGFVFSPEDPFCGVDLDNCIDPASGETEPWAHEILKSLDSYAEISPSGKGAKVFVKARKPGKCCRKACGSGEVEIYDQARFFTVTARRMSMCSAEVEDRQEELDAVYTEVFGSAESDISQLAEAEQDEVVPTGHAQALSDEEIIEKASNSRKSGDKFRALWDGKWNDYFNSASEADSSVVFSIAFYTKDGEQIDRLFRQSKLMRPKWDERRGDETYGQITIRNALENVTAQYEPRSCVVNTDVGVTETEMVQLGDRDPATDRLVLSSRRTLPTAEAFVREFHTSPEGRTLHSWAGYLHEWRGNRYVPIEDEGLKQRLLPWMHEALRYAKRPRSEELELIPFEANPSTVKAAVESIRAHVHLSATVTPPVWLDGGVNMPAPREILPCRSRSLHIPTGQIFPATPLLFVTSALDFDHEPDAPRPSRWLDFLAELWDGDAESLALLQEWFGYCLTADTSQQKMLLLVGPRRSGKGTIGRVLTRLVGAANVCGPTISSLAGPFGLQPLIGKSLAVVSDARFACKDMPTVVERLLCISGEDTLTIERKHIGSATLRLPTRLMFLTNELPRLSESSGALAGRFLVLRLAESFYGREDRELTDKLYAELPGILLWAVDGWKRLNSHGRFVQPASGEDAVRDLEDLSSPVGAFVRDRCVVGPNFRAWTSELYEAWKSWCESEGWRSVSTNASFGRDLAAAFPGIARRRGAGDRRFYQGIAIKGKEWS